MRGDKAMRHTATNNAIVKSYKKHFGLAITINSENITYKTVSVKDVQRKDGTVQKHRTYNTLCTMESDSNTEYTDYCVSAIEAIAPAMAYTAVKNVYVNECSPFIIDLLHGIISIASTNTETKDVLIEQISNDLLSFCPEYLSNVFPKTWMRVEATCFGGDTENGVAKAIEYTNTLKLKGHLKDGECTAILNKIKEVERQIKLAKDGITTEEIVHTYKLVRDSDGHSHKIPIIPYTEFIKTKYGVMIDKFTQIATDSDAHDIIQIAKLALLELVHCGLADSAKDLWMYRSYVYTRVNRYIRRQRTEYANNDLYGKYTETTDSGEYKEVFRKMTYIDKEIDCLERSSVIDSIEKCLISLLDKRANVHNVVLTFRYKYINGYNQNEIASKIGVSEKMVSKYSKQIDKALFSASMRDYVRSVYFA